MGFFQKVKDVFLSAFKPKAKTEQYLTKLPDFQTLEEVIGFVEQKYQQQNAQLMAENIQLKRKAEEKKKDKDRKKHEDTILVEVEKQKQELNAIKQQRTLKFKIEGLKDPPVFFLKNNRAIGRFMGFVLQETDEGAHIFYPWIHLGGNSVTDPGRDVKFEKFAHHFEDFFKDEIGIVSQMRGGKVDSNFDIGEDGRPILRSSKLFSDKQIDAPATVEDLKKLEERNRISEQERREYEQKIEKLKSQLNQYSSALMDERKEKEELEKLLADSQVEAEVATKDKDLFAASLGAEAKQKETATKVITDSLLAIQDTKVSQVLTERMNQSLLDAMHRLRRKYQEGLYKEEREIEETRSKDMMRSVAKEVVNQQAIVAPPPRGKATEA
jgi:hypothetical protein